MRRQIRSARHDWVEKVEKLGLTFHTFDGETYWNESAAYIFEEGEVEELERATGDLHEMCLAVVEHVVTRKQFARLAIPEAAWPVITQCWEDDPPSIYGRFDLRYDGQSPPKLLEYNADTPTSLLEAAVIQWHWLQEVEPSADQFNSIWEGLVEKWRGLKEEGLFPSGRVHFACVDVPEDTMTTAVMLDTASEVGLVGELMYMDDIGFDHVARRFVDKGHAPIEALFKLYPWEWILRDDFGLAALETYRSVAWIEPIWKMVLSNKAMLALLWELYPDHPNLLPAYLDGRRGMSHWVTKPFLGREGSNVAVYTPFASFNRPGPYSEGDLVYQAYSELPEFDGNYVVIGSWVIDGEARGIGVRESDTPITEDTARFVPHLFWPHESPESQDK